MEALSFILENNTFQFNDVFYRQRKGTAMGTKVAPIYATLTIGYLEQKLYNKIVEELNIQDRIRKNMEEILGRLFSVVVQI